MRLSRGRRLLIAASLLIVIAVVSIIVSSGSSHYAKVIGTAAQIRATEQTFLAANILIENLGAITPPAESTRIWLLTSHPISRDGKGVTGAEYPWIERSAKINVVSPSRAKRERIAQTQVIASIFGDGAKNDTVAEMEQIVDGEIGSNPHISAPGGATIVKWLKVHVEGTTAQLEADINVWESLVVLSHANGGYRLIRSLNLNQVDAFATLRLAGGHWSVILFDQAPWQQAT